MKAVACEACGYLGRARCILFLLNYSQEENQGKKALFSLNQPDYWTSLELVCSTDFKLALESKWVIEALFKKLLSRI